MLCCPASNGSPFLPANPQSHAVNEAGWGQPGCFTPLPQIHLSQLAQTSRKEYRALWDKFLVLCIFLSLLYCMPAVPEIPVILGIVTGGALSLIL